MESLSEKVSVNINSATISSIDLLVDNGYYSTRSDFINQALRSALQQHQTTIDRLIERHTDDREQDTFWFLGVAVLSAQELRRLYEQGKQLDVRGYGVLTIDEVCEEDILFAVVQSIRVKGKVICAPNVKKHFQLK